MSLDLWLSGYVPPSPNQLYRRHWGYILKIKKLAILAVLDALQSRLRDAQLPSSTPITSEEASNLSSMRCAEESLSLMMIRPRLISKSAKSKSVAAKKLGRTSGLSERDLFGNL